MLDSIENSKLRSAVIAASVAVIIFGSLVVLSSGSVMAASLAMSSDSITTDDGDIDGVTVDASGEITWDGADQQPGQTDVKLQVADDDGDDWSTIAEESEDLSGLAGTYSFSFSDVDLTDDSSWSESDFVSDNDGSTKETELSFRLKVVSQGDINGDGNNPDISQSNTASTTLTVVNEESSTGFGASGDIEGEGVDRDPEDNEQEGDD